jgi:hypothetical protein
LDALLSLVFELYFPQLLAEIYNFHATKDGSVILTGSDAPTLDGS